MTESTLKVLDEKREDAKDGEDNSPDFVFATAKGAAEFAKRRQEEPVRCVDGKECKRVGRDLSGK